MFQVDNFMKYKININNKNIMSQEELQKHKKKWKMWSQGFVREEIKNKMKIQEGMENYAANLIQKIKEPNYKADKKISKEIEEEIQSNVCGICLQLMVPPNHQPIIVIPCAHNVCKECLYVQNQNIYSTKPKLRLSKCPICRTNIESHALNRTLMALICSYTNNKQLLQKQIQKEKQDLQSGENMEIQKLSMRCDILLRQKSNLSKTVESFKKQKQILEQVIQTLKKQKKRNEQEMEKLEKQAKLINHHLTEKLEELTLIEGKLEEAAKKEKIVERTLKPLRQEKEKLEILEVAKLLQQKNPL